MLGLEEI
ncbi:hypothetical protein F383_31336 [Gossypium arboreum]|nr:hypothetical protein F383_21158 [Gossypium arboreum]KHG25115.1 hypothetical protein F383_31336 [Gossypium arboreum]